jgi:hypothetical protein
LAGNVALLLGATLLWDELTVAVVKVAAVIDMLSEMIELLAGVEAIGTAAVMDGEADIVTLGKVTGAVPVGETAVPDGSSETVVAGGRRDPEEFVKGGTDAADAADAEISGRTVPKIGVTVPPGAVAELLIPMLSEAGLLKPLPVTVVRTKGLLVVPFCVMAGLDDPVLDAAVAESADGPDEKVALPTETGAVADTVVTFVAPLVPTLPSSGDELVGSVADAVPDIDPTPRVPVWPDGALLLVKLNTGVEDVARVREVTMNTVVAADTGDEAVVEDCPIVEVAGNSGTSEVADSSEEVLVVEADVALSVPAV